MKAKPRPTADRIAELDRRVGRNLRRVRLERAITQAAIADHLGVVTQAVGRFESGNVRIAAGYLPIIAAALGTTIDALFDDNTNVRPLTVTAQRLAPFMRDVMSITSDQQLDALNGVAKALAEASRG